MQARLLSVAVVAALALPASVFAAAPAQSPAAQRALGLIDGHGKSVQRADADRFVARDVIVDSDGSEHVRFDRTYRGLPVIGGDVVVHSRNGQFKSASLTLKSTGRPDITPAISADQAIVEAGTRFGTGFQGVPTSHLVIYARGNAPVLAHEVVYSGFKGQTPTDMHYIVDAKKGKVLESWDTVETAASNGTFRTMYSGNVGAVTNSITGGYEMRDPSRGNGYTVNGANGKTSGQIYTDADNTWGNNTRSDLATAATDAQYGVGVTWDYYKNVHGRNGIANDGRGAYNRVHYGHNYVNAYWSDSCFCMTYGDGDGVTYSPLVNLDVAGHEMSHGVTSRSANLTYSGESGGLNEATSDIMGTMVEFYANNANDPGDYLIGEKIYIKYPAGNKALRYMFHPSLEGAGRSVDCWYSGVGSLDVHYSSGPANHFYYLLAEGSGAKSFNGVDHTSPTCNGSSVTGIGRDAAQKIWYRALTVYMTSGTNYAGARTAAINAASDLGYSTSAVAAAWSAVGVN